MAGVVFDAMVSAGGLILFSPLLLLIAVAVVLEDGLPVFFQHERVGRGGRLFRLWKFRSMRTCVSGRSITSSDDPRVTRVGRILRKYKLDELPQLWNVVRGEMSLVGPRPEIPRFVNLDHPVWRDVLQLKPGITDLASLVYRNEEELLGRSDHPEAYYQEVILPAKLAFNVQYAQARSFWSDIKLILLTVRYSLFPSGFEPARVLRLFPGILDSPSASPRHSSTGVGGASGTAADG
ncbi:Sugar transferase [Candidatus Sulfopaludibacter sp. SbA4]|nr:Sugar transferase [Candidatus Sulfopaludibacter sp. SbA4]